MKLQTIDNLQLSSKANLWISIFVFIAFLAAVFGKAVGLQKELIFILLIPGIIGISIKTAPQMNIWVKKEPNNVSTETSIAPE